jgi:hypothetical protein
VSIFFRPHMTIADSGTTSSVAFYRTLESVANQTSLFTEFFALPGPTVRIHVPFSGAFEEAEGVYEFIARRMPATWQRVEIEATDIHLPERMGYSGLADPRFTFMSRRLDLSVEDMPRCDLAIGLHPQVVGYDELGWPRIIEQVVSRSTAAIFTTWLDIEAERLGQLCEGPHGCRTCRWRNPFALPEVPGYDSSQRFHHVIVTQGCRPAHPTAVRTPWAPQRAAPLPGAPPLGPLASPRYESTSNGYTPRGISPRPLPSAPSGYPSRVTPYFEFAPAVAFPAFLPTFSPHPGAALAPPSAAALYTPAPVYSFGTSYLKPVDYPTNAALSPRVGGFDGGAAAYGAGGWSTAPPLVYRTAIASAPATALSAGGASFLGHW